jgi:hypothetical protein
MMSLKKRVLLFQGPGFLEDGAVEGPLQEMGYEIQKYQHFPRQAQSTEIDLGPDDTLILRSMSAGSLEDWVYTKVLGRSLLSLGKQIASKNLDQRPRIVATGRWALGSLFAGFLGDLAKHSIQYGWRNLSAEGALASWIRCKTSSGEHYYVLKTSDLVIDLQGASLAPILQSSTGATLGWLFENRVFLFACDPFSLMEGSQLPDYGYENQEDLLNGAHYLMNLLGAAKSEY